MLKIINKKDTGSGIKEVSLVFPDKSILGTERKRMLKLMKQELKSLKLVPIIYAGESSWHTETIKDGVVTLYAEAMLVEACIAKSTDIIRMKRPKSIA